MRRLLFFKFFFVLSVVFAMPVFADVLPDPCAGLLALVNRPSLTGSACVVPYKEMIVEGGYQYFNLSGGAYGYVTPQAIIRFGLPGNNEFLMTSPNYFHQTISPRAGWSAPAVSFKHEFGYNQHWVSALEAIVTIPSGSDAYGSRSFGETVNAIATYAVNPVLSFSGMLGVMSTSVQYIQNGGRFTSVNPDIFASVQLTPRLQIFAELYAQTRTGPGEGLGLLTDGGFYYLLTPCVSVDAELGQRITGNWGFQNYASAGVAVLVG